MEANISSSFSQQLLEKDLKLLAGAAIQNISTGSAIVLFICLFWAYSSLSISYRVKVPGAPVHGYWSWLEPTWLLQLRYARDAHKIIESGYKKYGKNDRPFVLRRQDLDVTILPTKYLSELRNIPSAKLSRGKANFMEWGDQWAMNTMWSHIDLPIKAISENRNGKLGKYLDAMKNELDYAISVELPNPTDWQDVDIQKLVQKLLGRMVGKMIVGQEACRTPEWLDLADHFTEDFVAASIIMRLLPKWSHPLVTNLIPQRWRLRRRLAGAKKVTDPCISRYESAKRQQAQGIPTEIEDTMVNWMLENAPNKEYVLKNLPTLILVILVPAAHTTAMAISNMIFDLCVRPEWYPVLRDEITDVTKKSGPMGKQLPAKDWVSQLEKLDSFFVESQRISQPLSITPNRYAVESFSFSDGLKIPKGALLGWVSIANQIDPDITSDPDQFDPMRAYRKRQQSREEASKHSAGQPSLDQLSFGFGSQACPGRNIAIGMLKMVLSRLLVEYDFKFAEGQAKPSNIHLLEFIIPDPSAKIAMRKRK